MVMKPTAEFLAGGLSPGPAKIAAAPLTVVDRPGFEPPAENSAVGCVTIRPGFDLTAMCLPIAWSLLSEKLLTPPIPPTPPQKSDIQF